MNYQMRVGYGGWLELYRGEGVLGTGEGGWKTICGRLFDVIRPQLIIIITPSRVEGPKELT
jgi:hypothetical protein